MRGSSLIRCAAGFLAVLVASVTLSASSGFARESKTTDFQEIAGLKVAVWLPEKNTPGPWPIIVFSHGFHGCAQQSTFLTKALAASGYAVFAPDHRDVGCADMRAWLERPAVPFRDPQQWDESTFADRAHDVERLLDALGKDPRYHSPPFDWQHVGLIGHSLGGYTVLSIGGAWKSLKDPRVKAVLALSPYSSPFIAHQTLGGIDAPVMYQGGTYDFGITPFVAKANGAYDQTPRPKYFVEFDGAGHFAWTDLQDSYHSAIIDYGRAFFDHVLKGKQFPPALTQVHKGVTAMKLKE
jgi:predicted dienelactone hydrolase